MTTTDSRPDGRGDSATRVPERVLRLYSAISGDEKHDPAAMSTLDVLWMLYDRVLRVDPRRPDRPDRDRFVLSKGHGPASYYAVLAATGFLDPGDVGPIGVRASRLGSPPGSRPRPQGSTLGHPVAPGRAVTTRRQSPARVRSSRTTESSNGAARPTMTCVAPAAT